MLGDTVAKHHELNAVSEDDIKAGRFKVDCIASVKAEQKTSARPTYAADIEERQLLRSETAAAKLVAKRVPHTATSYDGHELRSLINQRRARSTKVANKRSSSASSMRSDLDFV